ncbi:MAG: polymer-forming cytoskeletal protein [Labilibaculum antarcticum]
MKRIVNFEILSFSLISEGSVVNGNLSTDHNVRINGQISGGVESNGIVIIGQTGKVKGDITCKTLTVEGYVRGNINTIGEVRLKSLACVFGTITCKRLYVDQGAVCSCQSFEGEPIK